MEMWWRRHAPSAPRSGGCKPSPSFVASVGPCEALCLHRSSLGSVFARQVSFGWAGGYPARWLNAYRASTSTMHMTVRAITPTTSGNLGLVSMLEVWLAPHRRRIEETPTLTKVVGSRPPV